MRLIITIAWKDLQVLFRDRGALLLMLGAPLILTLGMGLVSGAFFAGDSSSLITINHQSAAGPTRSGDLLAYLAPAFAVLFLMYTVTQGGRSILAERDNGTLARMLCTPTLTTQVMGGKISGIFFSGFAQLGILILASSLLFNLRWGAPLPVLLLILAVAAAASGWGLLLAAVAKNTHQVSSMGTAMMLIFGVLGGSFFVLPAGGMVVMLSKLTPNAWAIKGFTTLASGGSLNDIAGALLALLLMATVLFLTAGSVFRRRPLMGLS